MMRVIHDPDPGIGTRLMYPQDAGTWEGLDAAIHALSSRQTVVIHPRLTLRSVAWALWASRGRARLADVGLGGPWWSRFVPLVVRVGQGHAGSAKRSDTAG